jgi:hypothetical protein
MSESPTCANTMAEAQHRKTGKRLWVIEEWEEIREDKWI